MFENACRIYIKLLNISQKHKNNLTKWKDNMVNISTLLKLMYCSNEFQLKL